MSSLRIDIPFDQGPKTPSPDRLFGDLGFVGDVSDRTGWDKLSQAEVLQRLRACAIRADALRELVRATPSTNAGYMPGDAAAVLLSFAGPMLRGLFNDKPDDEMVRIWGALMEYAFFAVPYYLPPQAGVVLAGSHPPDQGLLPEVRLPFPSVLLLFGAPLQFGPASGWVTSSTNGMTQWESLHNEGGALHGVVLCGDGIGVPLNLAVYLVSVGLDPDAQRAFIPGELRFGAFASVASNAASIVSWGKVVRAEYRRGCRPGSTRFRGPRRR